MDWTDARGATAADRAQIDALFSANWPRLAADNSDRVAYTLDIAAYFDVPSTSAFSAAARQLAIVHRAAHRLESSSVSGVDAKGGGPRSARSNERGSVSYAVAQPSATLSRIDAALGATPGGRAYLDLRDSAALSMPRVR